MSYCPDVLQGLITAEGGGRIAEEGMDTAKELCGHLRDTPADWVQR